MSMDSDKLFESNPDLSDAEQEKEFEYNEALLETILAAGNSASNKRNFSKRWTFIKVYFQVCIKK